MKTTYFKKIHGKRNTILKSGVILISLFLTTLLVTGNFLMPAFGASEEVLNGTGELDTVEQVKEWTLNNTKGKSAWSFDNGNKFSGEGAGKLESPSGSNVSFNSYVSYRFKTGKVPVSASLKLAYKKQYHAAQPKAGNWNVYAEIWKVGEDKPLEKITIDDGIEYVNFKAFISEPFTSMNEMTEYELRLVQAGTTSQSASSRLSVWFDQVELLVDYDSTPSEISQVKADTDTSVQVEFNEKITKGSAEKVENYTISPELKIYDAKLQENGKKVVLKTAKQTKGTKYTVIAENIQDISANIAEKEQKQYEGVDTTPPEILEAKAVTDNKIHIEFNEKLDNGSASDKSNYEISPALDIEEAKLLEDGKTVQLVTAKQALNQGYTLKASQISDLEGNVITSESGSFTGIDTTPPEIADLTVVDDTTLDIQFTEKLDPESLLGKDGFTISPELEVTGAELLSDDMTVRIKTVPQTWQTKYTVKIAYVSDISGNVITEERAEFRGRDDTMPEVISVTAIDDHTIEVVFSESVDALSCQLTEKYSISPHLQVQEVNLQEEPNKIRLATEHHTYLEEYTLTIEGISDLAGNTMEEAEQKRFLGADSTAPELAVVSVISSTEVTARFNEKINATDAEALNNIKIIDGLNNTELRVEKAVVQPDGFTVNLTTAPQVGGTNYILEISGIRDLAGNPIEGKERMSFIGISPPDASNPRVLSAKANDNSTVLVKFDVTLDPITSQEVENYIISPELPVTSALLQKDGVTVKLSTGIQTRETLYTVTIQNVQDQYGNTVNASSNTAFFIGNANLNDNPHGKYLSDTNQCAGCHMTHNSPSPSLLKKPTQQELCFLCHDAGGQSQFDVASEYNETHKSADKDESKAQTGSHHSDAQSSQLCSDCHNPHGLGQDEEGNTIVLNKLLQSRSNKSIKGGNEFCFSCHEKAMGNVKAINPKTYPADGVGHNNASFVINGETPFNPVSGSDIRCLGCHKQHASSDKSLLEVGGSGETDSTDTNALCYKCHKDVDSENPHTKTSSSNTNTSYPGLEGTGGQCINCHDPHGTEYGTSKAKMKTLRGPYSDGKIMYNGADFALCFGCHNSSSQNSKYDIQSAYHADQGGHVIKSSGGALAPGSKMPCQTCHTLHGTENNNKYMLKGELGSNLGDGRNECLACHKDEKVILGIELTDPSTEIEGHSDSDKPCLSCHDRAHDPS